MKIVISPKAEKQLKKLSKVDQIIIARKIRSLPEIVESQNQNLKKLRGYRNIFRLRVGVMRIVFKNSLREIYIVSIGHRKDVYKSF